MSISRHGGIFHNTIRTIIRMLANGKLDPAEVLESLLWELISANKSVTTGFHHAVNEPEYLVFARLCLGWLYPKKYPHFFCLNPAASASAAQHKDLDIAMPDRNPDDPLGWFIGHLNVYAAARKIPPHIDSLLRAYFSIYEVYRTRLTQAVRDQMEMFDYWNDWLGSALNEMAARDSVALEMLGSVGSWIPRDSRNPLLVIVMDIYCDERVYNLEHFMNLHNERLAAAIAKLTRQMKYWMSTDQRVQVAKTLLRFMGNENRELALFACELITDFAPWLPAGSLRAAVQAILNRFTPPLPARPEQLMLLNKLERLIPGCPSDMHDRILEVLFLCGRNEAANLNIKALAMLCHCKDSLMPQYLPALLDCLNRGIRHDDYQVRIQACHLLREMAGRIQWQQMSSIAKILWDMMKTPVLPENLRVACLLALSQTVMVVRGGMLEDFLAELQSLLDAGDSASVGMRSAALLAVGQMESGTEVHTASAWTARLLAVVEETENAMPLRVQAVNTLGVIMRRLNKEEAVVAVKSLLDAAIRSQAAPVLTAEILQVLCAGFRDLPCSCLSDMADACMKAQPDLSTESVQHSMRALAYLFRLGVPEGDRIIRFFIARLEEGSAVVCKAVRDAVGDCLLSMTPFQKLGMLGALAVMKRDEDVTLFSRVYHEYRNDLQRHMIQLAASHDDVYMDRFIAEKILRMN
ncbi:hypothetical protein AQUSIP_16040 [Aquicella siphonis]|uniref:Uncharacterized protein n=1 Tax=Aquicella siphonis TaxID=254247 RepID=A0A5E4PIA1_9COXI|nr:hypothetical protein [Aquicella siphonis]VVC76295.1 hypothetical protein AQUSIP_16040 [Aquicella siphonis]